MESGIFSENVIIITGASIGIGRELSLKFAEQGARLVLAARNVDQLEAVAKLCRGKGGKTLVVPTDVSDRKQVKNLISQTVETFGRIDTLINNAGISMWAEFDQVKDISSFERIMDVNYFGSVYCTYYALPYLKETRGRIVGVSSLAGKAGVPTRSGYAASKHAMVGFFDSLRVELDGTGVSVTLVYPGFVATEIRKRALGADGKPLVDSPVQEENVMTAVECAALMVKAIGKRRRELIMTFRGKIGQWIKLIAPGLVDRIARRAIQKGI